MSYVREKSFWEKAVSVRSWKGFGFQFLKETMAGQKLFLYNEDLPKVLNLSFNEKTCMYACRMCPYAEKDVRDLYSRGSEMSFETLRNIVASIPNDPYFSFDISAIGETLQFEPLSEFVAYMKRERPLVNTIISTNAALLSGERFRKLMEAGLDNIQFSLFAENSDDHRMITDARNFERVCENIREAWRIRQEAKSRKPFMQTFMMECAETRDKCEQFVRYWSQYVDKAFVRPVYNLGRAIEGMTPTVQVPVSAARHPCIIPWYSTAIRSTGDVLPCYMFHWHRETKDEVIGNINEMPLREIWRSEKFRKFREAHRALSLEEYPICQKCDLWDAYTNVWRKNGKGFAYDPVSLRDFLTPAPPHRGG